MYKIIKLPNINRYFAGFNRGIVSANSPFEALRFSLREELTLNTVLSELEKMSVEYEIFVLNYSIEKIEWKK